VSFKQLFCGVKKKHRLPVSRGREKKAAREKTGIDKMCRDAEAGKDVTNR
jgi:hypothetical protein